MSTQIHLPDQAIEYILFQRTEYQRLARSKLLRAMEKISRFSVYNRMVKLEASLRTRRIRSLFNRDMRGEYESFRAHLPEKCGAVLDIGCGVAGIDVLIQEHYRPDDLEIHLLDKTQTDERVFYGFESTAAFYNSLEVARNLLVSNGIPEERIHAIEAGADHRIGIEGEVDLVISLFSWGFHYPVSTYLERVREILAPGGSLIADLRQKTRGRELLEGAFGPLTIVQETPKRVRIVAVR